jgi:hypothetical protein
LGLRLHGWKHLNSDFPSQQKNKNKIKNKKSAMTLGKKV